jgi:transcriptional regulator with XRE-family HTH domain
VRKNQSGEKIRNALLEAGLTQKQLADKLGVKQQLISNWINGFSNPKDLSLKKIAAATGKPLSYFIENNPLVINNAAGNKNIRGGINQIIENPAEIELLKKDMDLQKKEIEILKLQIELLKKDKKK